MPSDVFEPNLGAPESRDEANSRSDDPGISRPADLADPSGTSMSGDELSVILTHGRPDPVLGEFHNSEAAPTTVSPGDHARADAMEALAALALSAADMVRVPIPAALSVSSSEALASLDLGEPSPIPSHGASSSHHPKKPSGRKEVDSENRGIPLSTVLLASYASAVTLGLLWVLWTGRRIRDSVEPESIPAIDARPDPGLRADQAHRLIPPPPIDADHLTTLGQPVKIGLIEATPLGVSFGSVDLERGFTTERKSGGKKALKLRIRLKNTSTDIVLAPLDKAFLRPRPRADPESYIETSEGGPVISLFPLAIESELSIVGQEFRELEPGESFETLIVSTPDADKNLTSEMTWRIRLRTDIKHTDDLGVRFHKEDVQSSK